MTHLFLSYRLAYAHADPNREPAAKSMPYDPADCPLAEFVRIPAPPHPSDSRVRGWLVNRRFRLLNDGITALTLYVPARIILAHQARDGWLTRTLDWAPDFAGEAPILADINRGLAEYERRGEEEREEVFVPAYHFAMGERWFQRRLAEFPGFETLETCARPEAAP